MVRLIIFSNPNPLRVVCLCLLVGVRRGLLVGTPLPLVGGLLVCGDLRCNVDRRVDVNVFENMFGVEPGKSKCFYASRLAVGKGTGQLEFNRNKYSVDQLSIYFY